MVFCGRTCVVAKDLELSCDLQYAGCTASCLVFTSILSFQGGASAAARCRGIPRDNSRDAIE